MLISQLQFDDQFQMPNPHKDLVNLRGFGRVRLTLIGSITSPEMEDRHLGEYSEIAMLAKGASFYRPD